MRLYHLVPIVVATVIVSCSTVDDDPTLEGVEWFLVSETAVDGSAAFTWDTDEVYSVEFMADSAFVATVDCNGCRGLYSAEINGHLAVQVTSCTERLCWPSYDERFKQILNAADSFRVELDELTIFSTFDDAVRILRLDHNARSQ